MTDPAVQAVAVALTSPQEYGTCWVDPHPSQRPRAEAMAQVAVDAYRRHVLASRPDAERLAELCREHVQATDDPRFCDGCDNDWPCDRVVLLAALADETAARRQAEAGRDRLAEQVRQAREVLTDSAQPWPDRVAAAELALDGSP